jgi:hypothetical protein
MTDALTRLADAVEAGTLPRPLPFPAYQAAMVISAYNGSLDAAKVLHEAVLPAMFWNMGHLDTPSLGYVCTVADGHFADSPSWRGFAATPARAWLLAILRALAQVQPAREGNGVAE